MTNAIELRQAPAQRLLAKKATCAHKDIGAAFGAAIKTVGDCYKASKAKMASAPVAVYLAWRESDCDMAVGCKVEGNVTLTGGCEWLDVPGGRHAFATHLGPYDTLHETHSAIRNWCGANGHKMLGPCWETYPIDPTLESDSSKWQTDIYYPVAPEAA